MTACTRTRYRNRLDALLALVAFEKPTRHRRSPRPFRCAACGKWHLTGGVA